MLNSGGGGGSKFKMMQEASLQNMYVLYQVSLYWYKPINL